MYKKSLIWTILAVTGILVTGCYHDNPDYYDPEVRMQFSPVIQTAVKADETSVYPTEQPFAVSLWQFDAETEWLDSTIEPFLLKETISFDGEEWNNGSEMFWPSKEKVLTMIAVSPVGKALDLDHETGVYYKIENVLEDQTDFLYTDLHIGLDKLSNGGIINVPFNHAFCRVDFRVKHNAPETDSVVLTGLTLKEVKIGGEFASLRKQPWAAYNTTADVSFFEGEEELSNYPERVGASYFMVPQMLSSSLVVSFKYKDRSGVAIPYTLESEPLSHNLLLGRHYSFTVSITLGDPEYKVEVVESQYENM